MSIKETPEGPQTANLVIVLDGYNAPVSAGQVGAQRRGGWQHQQRVHPPSSCSRCALSPWRPWRRARERSLRSGLLRSLGVWLADRFGVGRDNGRAWCCGLRQRPLRSGSQRGVHARSRLRPLPARQLWHAYTICCTRPPAIGSTPGAPLPRLPAPVPHNIVVAGTRTGGPAVRRHGCCQALAAAPPMASCRPPALAGGGWGWSAASHHGMHTLIPLPSPSSWTW